MPSHLISYLFLCLAAFIRWDLSSTTDALSAIIEGFQELSVSTVSCMCSSVIAAAAIAANSASSFMISAFVCPPQLAFSHKVKPSSYASCSLFCLDSAESDFTDLVSCILGYVFNPLSS